MDSRYSVPVSPLRIMSFYRQLLPDTERPASVFTSPAVLYLHGIARYYDSVESAPPCTAGHVFTTVLYGNNALVLEELATCDQSSVAVRPLLATRESFNSLVLSLQGVLHRVRAEIPCAVRDDVDRYFARLLRHELLHAGTNALLAA